MTQRVLSVQTATPDSVAPYAQLVCTGGLSPDFQSPEFDYWDALAVDETTRGMSLGVVVAKPGPYVGRTFERHNATVELLAPLDADMILVLGEKTSGELPDPDRFSAFRVASGEAMLLHPGTWHLAPVAIDEPVTALVAYGAGTAEHDKELVEIDSALGVEFVLER